MKTFLRLAAFALPLLSALSAHAACTSTITGFNFLDAGSTSRSSAWGIDGSSRYFALGGVYGLNGDYQADVNSDCGLDAHVTNWPANFQPTPLTPIIKAGLTNSAVSVKASAGSIGAVNCDNANTSSIIVEFFNTSTVTLGSTSPAWIVAIPAGGGGSNLPQNVSLGGSAIYAAAVTAYNGSTAPSTVLNCSIGYI